MLSVSFICFTPPTPHNVAHVVVVNVLVIEPRAITRLPGRYATHAKLSATATVTLLEGIYQKSVDERGLPSDGVAAFLEPHDGLAAIAPMPARSLRHLHVTVYPITLRTLLLRMEFTIA